jgi:beta-glucosidase
MPWLDKVGAVVEAWFPGTAGGEAIARVLSGEIDATGRLPVSFPKRVADLPRPKLDGVGKAEGEMFDVDYNDRRRRRWLQVVRSEEDRAAVRRSATASRTPSSPIRTSRPRVAGDKVTVSFDVKNVGARAGKDVPQVYVGPKAGGWEAPKRLAGFKKVAPPPGATQRVTVTVDPRLLATWDGKAHGWSIAAGQYDIALGASSRALSSTAQVTLAARSLPVSPAGK